MTVLLTICGQYISLSYSVEHMQYVSVHKKSYYNTLFHSNVFLYYHVKVKWKKQVFMAENQNIFLHKYR